MIKTAILDVTQIEPRFKHPTIFNHFDALESGEGFTILNDHDPKPLYYQLLGERGNIFTWEYLENGPEWWRVQITKPTQERKDTVGDIAAKDIRKAEVFKKLGIDFCCGGKQSLQEAAQTAGINEKQLLEELEKAENIQVETTNLDFNKWDIGFLADYIYNVHHNYIREHGPIIEQLADKVALRHGVEHNELLELANGMHEFMAHLYDHIEKEERQLFPLLKKLEDEDQEGRNKIKEIVKFMEHEHDSAGEELRQFRRLTKDYKLPDNACNSYTYLYDKIKAFESDLFQHIHLENNILFPKAAKKSVEQVN